MEASHVIRIRIEEKEILVLAVILRYNEPNFDCASVLPREDQSRRL